MYAKKIISRLLSIFLSFVLFASCICLHIDSAYASNSIKKVIKGKSTVNLSCRYGVVKKDYESFIKNPEYWDYTYFYYEDMEKYYTYDEESDLVWVEKPTMKDFFENLYDSNLDCSWRDVGVQKKTIPFSIKRKMCLVVPLSITVKNTYAGDESADYDTIEKGGVRVKLIDDEGTVIQNDYISLKGYKTGEVYNTWLYSDGGIQPKGNYKYIISNNLSDTDFSFRVKYSIIGYTQFSKTAKMKKSVSTRSGCWVKLGKLGSGTPLIKSQAISRRSVVSFLDIDENGNVYAYGRKKGTSYVTIKLKNGKKYKTKVIVKAGEPNFEAYLTGYNTRNNYFTVKVYNNGSSPVTFVRGGSKVVDKDYKRYDRIIRGSNVTVKAGRTKKIRFYVSGSTTWPEYEDFTLYTTMIYEGKTYPCHIWDEDSSYKRKNSWWTTYWAD